MALSSATQHTMRQEFRETLGTILSNLLYARTQRKTEINRYKAITLCSVCILCYAKKNGKNESQIEIEPATITLYITRYPHSRPLTTKIANKPITVYK